MFKDNILLI
nr:unnamed protein product [Callosobruchus analis]